MRNLKRRLAGSELKLQKYKKELIALRKEVQKCKIRNVKCKSVCKGKSYSRKSSSSDVVENVFHYEQPSECVIALEEGPEHDDAQHVESVQPPVEPSDVQIMEEGQPGNDQIDDSDGEQPSPEHVIQPGGGDGEQPYPEPLIQPAVGDGQQPCPERDIQPDNVTPRKAAKLIMEDSNLNPSEYPTIVKQIAAYKTLVGQLSQSSKKEKLSILKKKGTKKSRLASQLARDLGINRKSVLTTKQKVFKKKQEKIREKAKVARFLKEPEHSTPLPGKKDVTQIGHQKYGLNETLANLHLKYKAKYPESKISLAKFCKLRPTYIKTIRWTEKRQCLCCVHQNASLKLKAININTSVGSFLQTHTSEQITELLEDLPDENIRYREWQKEDIVYNENIIKKLKLKQVDLPKEEFCEIFSDEFLEVRNHVDRMYNQFDQVKLLKNKLSVNECTMQIDYSENYSCSQQDEPAQAFYDRCQVTIHPMVVHFRTNDGVLKHKSYVGISPETAHSAPTTLAFLRKVVPLVKQLIPQLSMIHYLSDSPVSQYRNKSICQIVALHSEYFPPIRASWDYMESGHGKSACDGVGGAIKHYADNAVKSGRVIGGANDFFDWAEESNQKMICVFVSRADVVLAERILRNAQPVRGLSKCHSIRAFSGHLHIRDKSCYKDCCQDFPGCPGWNRTQVIEYGHQSDSENETSEEESTAEPVPVYSVGSTVEITYNSKVYGAKVEQVNLEKNEYHVKALKKNQRGIYICPKSTWTVWVHVSDIVKLVE